MEVQWCAPVLCGLEIFPLSVKLEFVKVPERDSICLGLFIFVYLYISLYLKSIFCLLFLLWKRAKKYSDVSELMFCSFLLFFLVHLSMYTTSAFGAKVGIFIIIIIYRYLPDFLSITATFHICSSNWWLFLRLLKIINISNTSQQLEIF